MLNFILLIHIRLGKEVRNTPNHLKYSYNLRSGLFFSSRMKFYNGLSQKTAIQMRIYFGGKNGFVS